MKDLIRSRIFLFGVALVVVASAIIATQVSWILKAARIEESFLNQRVSMALCSAMDALSVDKGVCSSVESCSTTARGSFQLTLQARQHHKIDSVIRQHLLFYNIDVPFTTTLASYSTKPGSALPVGHALLFPKAVAGSQNVVVRINIPSKNELIRKQISATVVLSIAVLIVLAIMMFNSLRGLLRERELRSQTTDFINAMAHDLKTPISNISLAVSLLASDDRRTGAPPNPYFSILATETERLKQRTRQILCAASVDAVAGVKPITTTVDLHELLVNTVKTFQLQISEVQGEISTVFAATRHDVKTSQLELTTAITNIIDNAIAHAYTVPSITVSTKSDDEKFVVEISDNGPGIPLEVQELIFRKSYRTGANGFGLGLYLARNLVEKQGGNLQVSSDGRNGSCFIIALPLT